MSIRSNIAIIYSEKSRKLLAEKAEERGDVYKFRGSQGICNWVIGDLAYLAVNGLASILRRLELKFDIVEEKEWCEYYEEYNTAFCPNANGLASNTIDTFKKWLKGDNKLIVSGNTNIPNGLIGINSKKYYNPSGFCGVKWLSSLKFNPEYDNYTLSPPNYSISIVKALNNYQILGELIEYKDIEVGVKGVCLNGDAVIVGRNTVYFALPIFEYVGGILQKHVSIEKLRKLLGIKANLYIDIIAWYIKNILLNYGCEQLWGVNLKLWGEYENVLILRHDTDSSNDPTYLNYEIKNRIPATYAILPDKNRKYYLSQIKPHDFIEASFHYNAGKNGKPDKNSITGKGLYRQMKKAKERYHIPIETMHKHWNYFYYPESIEAMDYLYDNMPEVLGLGTMFRLHNLKYSNDKKLFETYVVEHPNVGIPFWFPFKMVLATVEKYKILRGWDITHLIEPEPSMTDMIFENANKLLGGVYMLGFHPAHARGRIFNPNGNYEWYLYAVNEAIKRNWWIANYKMVCEKLNDWENLNFRIMNNGLIVLENPTDKEIKDIVINIRGNLKKIQYIKAHGLEIV